MQVKHIRQIPTPIYIINDVLGLGGWNIIPRFKATRIRVLFNELNLLNGIK